MGPPVPAKTLSYDLIAIHDAASPEYNADCIACHGDRTKEFAMDGKTPAAHATMLTNFGDGNERCMACHGKGPDFLSFSRGGLREQVDMADLACAECHEAKSTLARPLYAN